MVHVASLLGRAARGWHLDTPNLGDQSPPGAHRRIWTRTRRQTPGTACVADVLECQPCAWAAAVVQ
eukprot:2735203-Lingulodinium_polyedra.AAC.1